ncbi:molybdopterin-dependent oxidoreductase [Pseudoruegeria sp. HB172150]|uniref:molybdopterin-dependent oxidoreductase n=1 Tax=Pseudoruegeria sp. HB172150 TaxID=2721164 RepID=UPI0020A64AED|nr:molybdopterin-dependent oxidoreductase [Pseudoruegeria sp. HB172150]
MHSFLTRAALAMLPMLPMAAVADELAAPEGHVILTITGAIAETNDGDAAVFDLSMLEALEAVTFETSTIWTEGIQSFTGVPLATLMEAVGAEGDVLNATAINDYSVEIPREDWVEDGPIVAYLNNGETMSVRDKGPLWVVYPYDSSSDYQTELIYSRSIWQLDRIVVGE